MEKEDAKFDVAVIGGGIIGLATAARLAERGERVVLLERARCHSGASANSHRIIHGGVRYLQHGDLPRLARSLTAQQRCLESYPDLVKPLRCYLPISGKGLQRSLFMKIAAFLYQLLSGLIVGQIRYAAVRPGKELAEKHPWFGRFANTDIFSWDDARLVDPDGLAAELLKKLSEKNVSVHEEREISEVSKNGSGYRISADNGEQFQSTGVVFTLGSNFGSIPVIDVEREFPDYGWTKAFNLVLNVPVVTDSAVGFTAPSGQVLFFSPRDDKSSAIGTWYVDGESGSAEVSDDEIERALAEVQESLGSECDLSRDNVIAVESGLLPIVGKKNGKPVLESSERVFSTDGVVEVLSTKYTTFPVVADIVAGKV